MLTLNILILTFIISAIILIKIIKPSKNKNDNNNDDLIYKNTEGLICKKNDIDDFIKIYVFYCTEHAPNFILEDRNGNTIINFKGDYIDSNQKDIKNPKNQVDFTFYTLGYDEIYSNSDGSLISKYLLFKLYLKYNDYRYIVESKGYEDENFEVRVEYEIDYAKKICKRNEYNKMRYI
ncbi:hypothetical protein WKT07_08205 [Mediterraneibacter sp. HCN-7094]